MRHLINLVVVEAAFAVGAAGIAAMGGFTELN